MKHLLIFLFLVSLCGAQQYSILKSDTKENLRGVSAVSNSVVWASGTHGTYLRSSDGGTSWTTGHVPGAEQLDFRDVEAFSADQAYLLGAGPGDQSRIYRTVDGGKTWSIQFTNPDPKGFFDCMAFWDTEHGIAVGDPVNGKFELIATGDGKNWRALAPATIPDAVPGEGAFAASGTCLAVKGKANVWFVTGGKTARVFRSEDRGNTWTATLSPITQGAESSGNFSVVFARDARHGVVSGGDYKNPEQGGVSLAFTEDGGRTWKAASVLPQAYFSAVGFCGKNILAVGAMHAAFGSGVGPWKRYWDVKLNALSFAGKGEAFAVGPDGWIVKFTGLQ